MSKRSGSCCCVSLHYEMEQFIASRRDFINTVNDAVLNKADMATSSLFDLNVSQAIVELFNGIHLLYAT